MSRFQTRLLATLAALALACVSSDYAGKTYPATTHVDLFFSPQDIQRSYETMGELSGEADDSLSYDDIKEQLIEDAKEKGADAILFYDLATVVTGSTASTTGDVTNTWDRKNKVIKAKLLKYRQ